jgi:hypothetical protein
MTSAPPILSIRDETEWHAESLPDIDVKLPTCIYGSDWLRDAPSAFDTRHTDTARLYETNSGLSPTILGDFAPDQPRKSIPMGYTDLHLLEKRAVIAEGRLVRLWRSRYEPSYGTNQTAFYAVIEGNTFGNLRVGLDNSIGHAVGQAQTLSDRMNGAPVIVVRLLSSTFWH